MRQITFRGKRVDNGEWVNGDLIHGQGLTYGRLYILPQTKFYCNDLDGWQVIPETVCQYTGLKDKNDKEIYEGDILKIITESGRVELFICEYNIHRRCMASGWEVQIPGFSFVNSEGFPTFPIIKNFLNGNDLDIIEVVENIHDNPELINK